MKVHPIKVNKFCIMLCGNNIVKHKFVKHVKVVNFINPARGVGCRARHNEQNLCGCLIKSVFIGHSTYSCPVW